MRDHLSVAHPISHVGDKATLVHNTLMERSLPQTTKILQEKSTVMILQTAPLPRDLAIVSASQNDDGNAICS